jgi:undecaprenyl-phosphate 4-deoxy-4-formamido-L-arabinose transferase
MAIEQTAAAVRTKVLVVDDHPVLRMGLVQLINNEDDLEVCGEADNERSAFQAVHQLRPNVAVVDWTLGNKDAAELITTLRQDCPQMPVLVLSFHEEMAYAPRAHRAGASGYIMKQDGPNRIVAAIRRVAAGESYFTERVTRAISGGNRKGNGKSGAPYAPAEEPGVTGLPAGLAARATPPSRHREDPTAISIVIPVHNSEQTIERLCHALIRELAPSYQLQIVLVNDASTDGSAAACQRLHEENPEVFDCITLSRNFGEHNAVMAGLNYVEGDYCVIMDDDFQNPPSEARKLIEQALKGYDVVYARYEAKMHSLIRNFGSRLHNWIATRALGKPPDLYLSSFKILSRFLVREITHYTGPSPYLDAIVLRTTRDIGVVTVRHLPRSEGRSGYTFRKLVSLWGNMIIAFSLYPLRLLMAAGAILLVVGIAYGGYTLLALLTPEHLIPKPTPVQILNASGWFFRGITMLAVGIVGEYVGRIYLHLAREPQFIVRNALLHCPPRPADSSTPATVPPPSSAPR